MGCSSSSANDAARSPSVLAFRSDPAYSAVHQVVLVGPPGGGKSALLHLVRTFVAHEHTRFVASKETAKRLEREQRRRETEGGLVSPNLGTRALRASAALGRSNGAGSPSTAATGALRMAVETEAFSDETCKLELPVPRPGPLRMQQPLRLTAESYFHVYLREEDSSLLNVSSSSSKVLDEPGTYLYSLTHDPHTALLVVVVDQSDDLSAAIGVQLVERLIALRARAGTSSPTAGARGKRPAGAAARFPRLLVVMSKSDLRAGAYFPAGQLTGLCEEAGVPLVSTSVLLPLQVNSFISSVQTTIERLTWHERTHSIDDAWHEEQRKRETLAPGPLSAPRGSGDVNTAGL